VLGHGKSQIICLQDCEMASVDNGEIQVSDLRGCYLGL
jgi:hypothetical protein